jgi:hypothetical protein
MRQTSPNNDPATSLYVFESMVDVILFWRNKKHRYCAGINIHEQFFLIL